MDNAYPNLYVTEKINVIFGFTMWHFQKSEQRVRRWRRSLSCLSQVPEIIFFIYTSRVWIWALRWPLQSTISALEALAQVILLVSISRSSDKWISGSTVLMASDNMGVAGSVAKLYSSTFPLNMVSDALRCRYTNRQLHSSFSHRWHRQQRGWSHQPL